MKKLMAICAVLSTLVFWADGGICRAETFTVPLNVSGNYNGNSTPFSFDLGTALSEVHSVSFVCAGRITAGVDWYDEPFSWNFVALLEPETSFIIAYGPLAGAATYPNPEPFSWQSEFNLYSGDWNFLLDGIASGEVGFPIVGGKAPGPQVYPTGYIDSASIVVDATVIPEPATFLLLGFSVVLVLKKTIVFSQPGEK